MLCLREYQPADFERLLEIDLTCFAEGIAYSAAELHHFLSLPSAFTIIGEDEGDIQGFIVADHYRPRGAKRYVGKIITIDVLADARRSGLGSKLLQAAEKKLVAADCGYVSLEAAVDNLPAMGFYKKHGYSALRILPRYYMGSLDALLMGKRL